MADSLRERVNLALADLWDPPFAILRLQLADRFVTELEAASAETARAVRQSSAESLNLGVRRILHAATVTDIGAALLEAASGYCGRAALLVHKGDLLTGWRTYGLTRNGAGDEAGAEALAQAWAAVQVQVSGAPAFAQAIESRETVVSLSLADHLSAEIVQLLDLTAEERVYLFPLSLRQIVVGVIYADGRGAAEGVLSPAIEMLCAVAEAALEAVSSRTPVTARGQATDGAEGRLELPVARPAPPPPVDWSELTAEEQEQHLRAQRFARVLVADLQLYRAAEIREGKQARNLYGRLQDEIEKSREVYHRKFGQAIAGLDYFHVELLRTLADNEESLMGPDYPGPLVASVTAP
jgi:hypothetical protein